MTREEAIESLRGILTEAVEFENSVCYVTEEDREPLEMAIQALEQEPYETQMIDKSNFSQEQYKADLQCAYDCGKASVKPCEDVIDRAEAMTEIMMFAGNVKSDEEDIYIKVSDAVQLLRELPPVNPQVKTGHWINGDCEGGNCSICGEYYAFYPESGDFNYCPNCGRSMVEPQESEDKE